MRISPFWRRTRGPARQPEPAPTSGGALLVPDVDAHLARHGDHDIHLGDGVTFRLSDLLDSLDSGADIPVRRAADD